MPIIADLTPSAGPTLDQMVTEIVSTAQGHSVAPDRVITLADALTDDALTLTVIGSPSPGVFEIGDELIYVTAVDENTGTCTIHPSGRGWTGTSPAAHAAGAVVTEGPALPRARVAAAVNDVLTSLFPTIFGVAEVEGELTETMFEIPADAEFICDVRVLRDDEWHRVVHWEAEMSSSAAATGKVVRIPRVSIGSTVQVVYGLRPEVFTAEDQRWTDTGLGLGVKDIVVMGVLARFVQALDIGRLTDRFVSPRGDTQQPQLGAGFAMARQLRTDFQAALDREAMALRKLYPARSHFVR